MVKVEKLPHSIWKTEKGYIIFSHFTGGWIHTSRKVYERFKNNKWKKEMIEKFFSRGLIKVDGKIRPVALRKYEFEPTLIEIEVTRGCTLRCKYCYASAGEKNAMKKTTLEKIAELISKLPNKRIGIQLSGGEPLLEWKKIKWLIDKIHELKDDLKELKVNIETNGTLVTPKIARELKEYDVKIGVSIDGRENEHNIARVFSNGKGSYKYVIKAIENLRNAGYTWISSITTFHRFNISNPESVLRHLWLDLGISASRFNYAIFMGRLKQHKEFYISPREFLEIKKRIFIEAYRLKKSGCNSKLLDEYFDNLTRMYDKNICLSRGCRAGIRMFFIDVDGNIYPCTRLRIPYFKLGDVFSFKNLKESYEKFISLPLRSSSTLKWCEGCPWGFFCEGGCPGESLHFYGNSYYPSPFCEFIKGYYKFLLDFIIEHYREPELLEITF
jgi:uncharacterized protein